MADAARATAATQTPTPAPSPTAWAPLHQPVFRRLWLAQMVSNLGTWMQMVGAQWLVVTLTGSAALVGLVQTASTLPVVLLAAPAGVLADVLDRRRVLVTVQLAMVVVAAVLTALAFAGHATATVVLAFTFLLGCGAAFIGPAWQAIQPELVPRPQIPSAAALGAVNMNLARAVGPALGGTLVAAVGAGWVFGLNAASFVVVAAAVASWRRVATADPVGRERMVSALRSGARYVLNAPAMRRVLARSVLFVPAASALWALLPLVATRSLDLGASGYGVLLGALGAGAVAGAFLLPPLRRWTSTNTILSSAFVLFAAALAATAVVQDLAVAVPVLAVAGLCWMTVLSTLNATAQVVLPGWVRARALSYYLVVFMGGQALGGLVWGIVAEHAGLDVTLVIAAGVLLVAAVIARRLPLIDAARVDPTPSAHWPDPPLAEEVDPSAGPVLVLIEYRVREGGEEQFLTAMTRVARSRRRTGAHRWELHRDPEDPAAFVESFALRTWEEHRRQHSVRQTVVDQRAEDAVRAHLDRPPTVRHLLDARLSR